MTDSSQNSKENEIRRMFQRMSFQLGLGTFFVGLGIQSSIIHAAQMGHVDHSSIRFDALLVDTVLFFVGAVGMMRGARSLGKALMLIAGMNPNWPKN